MQALRHFLIIFAVLNIALRTIGFMVTMIFHATVFIATALCRLLRAAGVLIWRLWRSRPGLQKCKN